MTKARELSDRYTEAINAHDPVAIGALFAPDGTLEEPAGRAAGRDEVVAYWQQFFAAFPDLRVVDEVEGDGGDTAINEWSAVGTHLGPLETPDGTVEATGRSIALRGCDVIGVRGGEITGHRVYYDPVQLGAQLGLEPAGVS